MEAEKYPNPQLPALPIHYQLGDWVQEYSPITKKMSPPMYIVAMFKDTLYLEIDHEQGDPFEVDIENVRPIPLSKDFLVERDIYGKRIVSYEHGILETIPGIASKWELNDWVDIHKYKSKFIAKYHRRDDEYIHVIYLRYVHDLQHFYRLFEIDKPIIL